MPICRFGLSILSLTKELMWHWMDSQQAFQFVYFFGKYEILNRGHS